MTTAPEDRRRTILAALSPTEVRSVNALSRLTGVSVITVRRDLRVLCLSLGAGAAISAVRGTTASIAGGMIDPESLSLFSAQAVDAVRGFRADVAVLSTCAVSATEGLTVIEESDAILKRAIMASSARVILPVAPRKLGRTHTYRFGTVADLDELLTTADAAPEVIEDLREAGLPISVIER